MSAEGKSVVAENSASAVPNIDGKVAGSEQKSPTTSDSMSPKSIMGDEKERTKVSGLKAPSTSRIGRLCLAHQTPKAGPPPTEPKNGGNQSDETMSRLSEEYLRSPLADVSEENELDFLRAKYSRSSISPDSVFARPPKADRKISNGSLGGDLYMEATGRRRSSDHGVILTADTDSFIIGQKVWVGGIRPGQIAYIGETHFAPGDWAGVVLDEPNGKNDGCVSGKRYFQCEPKKGIFSRLTRLTHYPLPNASLSKEASPSQVSRSILSPERSRATSPTSSIRSSMRRSPGKQGMTFGDRVIVSSGLGSRAGILKYIGETKFAQGTWCGVQLDEPTGKNDGSIDGIRYFECPSKHGVFVPIAKVTLSPSARKSRLSRAGSRESLTSVGTLNSIATTNTSRLRMGVQRIPTATKLASAPKNTYSLQDVIREKQNHIEQLMIERDLDREDAQNQAMLFQKNIGELKNRVTELEKLLEDERKKTDELQCSIDEAQFCGDELNAQTQVYKEKIIELEQRLLSGGGDSTDNKSSNYTTEYDTLKKESEKLVAEVESLRNKLEECAKDYEFKSYDLVEREQQLQEEVEFLKQENEEMRKELLAKDESAENLYLTTQQLQNALLEKTAALKKLDDEGEQNSVLLSKACSQKDELIKQLQSDLESSKAIVEGITKQNNETTTSLTEMQNENKSIKLKLEEAAKELISLKELYDKAISAKEESLIIANNFKEEIEHHKKSQADTSEQNAQLQASLEAKSNELSELAKRYKETQQSSENTSKESSATKTQLTEASNTIAVLESEIILKEQEAETNKILIEELTRKVKDLEEILKQKEDSSSKLLENSTAQAEVLKKYEADYQTLEKDMQNVSKSLSEREEAILKLTTEYEIKCKLIENITQEKEQLANDFKQDLDNKTKQIRDLSEKLQESECMCAALKSFEEKFNEAEAGKECFSAEIEELKHQLNSLTSENSSKLTTIEEYISKLKDLEFINNDKQLRCDGLEKSLREVSEQLENFKQIKSACETRISELEIESGDKSRALEALSQKYDEVSNQYKTLQQELINLKSSTSDTNSEVVRLTESLVEKQKSYEALMDESNNAKNKLERDLQESSQCVSTLQNKLKNLKEEIELKNNSLNELQSELASSKRNCDDKDKEIENLKQVIQAGKDNLQKILATNFSESESLKSQLDIQISSLQGEISALQSQLENTKAKSNSTEESLLNQISEYGNEKEKLLSELKNLQVSKGSLESILEQQKEAEHNSIQNFTSQLQKKDEEISGLNNAISTLTQSSHTLNARLTELEAIRKSLQEANEELKNQLISEETQGKCQVQQIEQLKAVIQEKDTEKEKFIATTAQLQSQLSSGEKDKANVLETLQQSKIQMEDTINNLKIEITHKENDKSNLQKELEKQQESCKNLEKQLKELFETNDIIQKQLSQKEETINAQTGNILHLNELVGQLQSDAQSYKQQMAEMISVHTDQIEVLNKKLLQKTEECSILLKCSEDLKTQSSSQAEKLSSELSMELESQKVLLTKYDALSKEHDSCKARIAELENLLGINNKTIEELTAKVQGLESTLATNANRNSTVLSELERLQGDFDKLKKDKSTSELLLESEISKLKSDTRQSKDVGKTANDNVDGSVEHINFLNSIIADMQKKNEGLKARIEFMETAPLDFTKPEAFHIVGKRNPAPRLFCDICDIFDAHDTEDCPLQSSDSPGSLVARSPSRTAANENGENENAKKLPPPRKFCDICDVFDAHETEECPLQCY